MSVVVTGILVFIFLSLQYILINVGAMMGAVKLFKNPKILAGIEKNSSGISALCSLLAILLPILSIIVLGFAFRM